jgi:DNA-binding CsgD family transcriptional regulator/tetratricopeptide (TPR) repeat protein
MPLIGRAHEQEVLRAAGSGVVVLEGEPGIGKSRLLAWLADESAGATVLAARASEYEADLPYALWAEALGEPVEAGDRHGTHRRLRERLEALAEARRLVVCLDDVHWADPASRDALLALIHRPPAGSVLLVLATRPGQFPLERAKVLRVGPLSSAEARELVGADADAVYADSGGNPFYLEQLVRAGGEGAVAASGDGTVPPAVAAALAAELGGLGADARRLLEAAAVVGDPFDVDLAAEVAEMDGAAALVALDDLLLRGLVREGGAPRRFAFRHPVVRHAVYEAAPGGWRLGAHGRAAEALARRGAGAVERAHHVEQAAGAGDEAAIALLSEAAAALQSPAPAAAARYHAAALRLTPAGAAGRTRMQLRLSEAQAAAGDAAAAHDTLLDALGTAAPEDRLALTVAVANTEWWLGRTREARRRLQVALSALPAEPSPDRIRLRLALALTSLMACDLAGARDQASDAAADARAIGDPVFEAAALAAGAIANASAGDGPKAVDEAAAAFERLTPAQLATRLPGFWMLGRSRRCLGHYEAALADLDRGAALARETGRENVRLQLTVERVAVLIELGRLAEAIATAEQGVELARLAGNPPMLLWAHCALSSAHLAAGDVGAAVQHAEEAAASGVAADFHAAGQPAWALGAALAAAGEARGVTLLAEAEVLPADRPALAADLAEARGEDPRPFLGTAPFAAARARLAEGRALAGRAEAIAALREAEAAFASFGARRRRDEAVRELRRLGHRVRARPAGSGDGDLTAREREIAELVAAGRTNREVAAQLVLSERTIEAHLRNVYAKCGVRSRVELTRRLAE